MAKWENCVFTTLTLPSRSLSYSKIMQGECNGKAGKLCFHNFDTAEPKLILYKDNANERNESLLSDSRVQLILYKDNARRVQWQSGKTVFSQL